MNDYRKALQSLPDTYVNKLSQSYKITRYGTMTTFKIKNVLINVTINVSINVSINLTKIEALALYILKDMMIKLFKEYYKEIIDKLVTKYNKDNE